MKYFLNKCFLNVGSRLKFMYNSTCQNKCGVKVNSQNIIYSKVYFFSISW